MKQWFLKSTLMVILSTWSLKAGAQAVVPVTTASTVIPTTAASPVVTSATTATTTSTTYAPTLMDYYLQQVAAEQATALAQENAQAKATALGQQLAAGIKIGMAFCPFATESSAQKTRKSMYQISNKLEQQNRQNGNVYDASLDEHMSQQVGEDRTKYIQSEGCDRFMDKSGKLGAQGIKALSLIREDKEAFSGNLPDDVNQICPNYKNMDSSQRDLFWVWAFMSMASSESSCNPEAQAQGIRKGKVATGLFALEPAACNGETNLKDPDVNTECAVKRLGRELKSRDTLSTPVSGTTYWGVLRNDDWNKKRGGDIPAAQKTRAILRQYRFCSGGENSIGEAQASSADGSTADKTSTDSAANKDAASSKTKRAPSSKTKKVKPIRAEVI